MNEERWITTLKIGLFILAVIVIALLVTHTNEIRRWLSRILADSYESQIQQILE